MRTKNSLKNISVSFLNNVLLNILRFILRTIFIKVLGEKYLGINGMLSNVLGVLAFADLGIGSAISYSLYSPLAENDETKVKSLMKFYKRAYMIIAIVIFVAGLTLVPFLDFFVKDPASVDHLQLYYFVFLIDMVMGYLFTYKRTLIIADQKEYKIVPIIMIFNFLITGFQIIMIIIFKNYFIYIITQTIITFIENIFVNLYINKKYPYIKDKNVNKMTQEELKPIKKNIKALMYHKVGSYFVDSTDNLIISKFLGLQILGLYSNYYLIINMLNTFINSALNSIISSIGNVNAKELPRKRLEVFKTLNFISFIIFSTCSLCLYNLFNLFIGKIWLSDKFLIDSNTVLIICVVFFINGLMHTNDAVKASAGLYDKDKWVPIIQSIINIVFSIIFVKFIGLSGVFVGTLISALFVMTVKPIIIYKYIFEEKAFTYYLEFFKQIIILVVSGLISSVLISFIPVLNPFVLFLIYAFISIFVLYGLIFIFYYKSFEFNDLKSRIMFILKNDKGSVKHEN